MFDTPALLSPAHSLPGKDCPSLLGSVSNKSVTLFPLSEYETVPSLKMTLGFHFPEVKAQMLRELPAAPCGWFVAPHSTCHNLQILNLIHQPQFINKSYESGGGKEEETEHRTFLGLKTIKCDTTVVDTCCPNLWNAQHREGTLCKLGNLVVDNVSLWIHQL